ncbi:hypothetical protein H1C71_031951 [Ictidomys tridecemlineatus]|nr:hypothetical protein H1C71_031951 [Ictidomys tridecemlineatus]
MGQLLPGALSTCQPLASLKGVSLFPMQPVRGCQAGFQEPSLPKPPLSSAQERDLRGKCLVFSLFSLQEQRQTTENRKLLAQAWSREISTPAESSTQTLRGPRALLLSFQAVALSSEMVPFSVPLLCFSVS